MSLALVSCFVLFPLAAFALVAVEPWFESSPWRWALAIPGCAVFHLALLWLRARGVAVYRGSDMEEDELSSIYAWHGFGISTGRLPLVAIYKPVVSGARLIQEDSCRS